MTKLMMRVRGEKEFLGTAGLEFIINNPNQVTILVLQKAVKLGTYYNLLPRL